MPTLLFFYYIFYLYIIDMKGVDYMYICPECGKYLESHVESRFGYVYLKLDCVNCGYTNEYGSTAKPNCDNKTEYSKNLTCTTKSDGG